MSDKTTEECTYFDQRRTCTHRGIDNKVCGERPVMRKTGKCTPHSVHSFDMNRKDDWIDCYQGCLKHDPLARKAYLNRLRDGKIVEYKEPIRIPAIDRLSLLHKHETSVRNARLGKVLEQCIDSRGIDRKTIAALLGITVNTFSQKLGAKDKAVLNFMEVCDIIAFLRLFDERKKMEHKR